MNRALDQLIEAVLYEGFILYPYRPSSKKNRQRFTFGLVYPQAYSVSEHGLERCAIQTECLVEYTSRAEMEVTVRFLHPMLREVAVLTEPVPAMAFDEKKPPRYAIVPELRVEEEYYQTWQEAVEHRICIPGITLSSRELSAVTPFSFEGLRAIEPLKNGRDDIHAMFLRRQESIQGVIEISVRPLDHELARLTVRVVNQTPIAAHSMADRDLVLLRTMASCHTILTARGAAFCSLLEPAPGHEEAASRCVNLGTWPVLVGDERKRPRDTILSSPIILYDYPTIAPESPGSYFDGTEIDEMLTLRVQTLTEQEKAEMRASSDEGRRLLERTESLSGADLLRMHGTRRDVLPAPKDFFNPAQRLSEVSIAGVPVGVGGRVRLRPSGRADIFDVALRGRVAEVEAIEEDFEGRVHLAVVLEDDPGKDLGLLRQPGHRFFFGLEEVEPCTGGESIREEPGHE